MEHSEIRYRRLFQTAKDGILILDAHTGKVIDANPFMTTLLGFSHDEFLDKELWEIGLFRQIEESQAAYRKLCKKRATPAMKTYLSKAEAGRRSKSNSSATSMRRTTTRSCNATFATSPNAAACSG